MRKLDLVFKALVSSGQEGINSDGFEKNGVRRFGPRVQDLRDVFGCKCRHGINKKCNSIQHVLCPNWKRKNPLPNYYFYLGEISKFKGGEKNETK